MSSNLIGVPHACCQVMVHQIAHFDHDLGIVGRDRYLDDDRFCRETAPYRYATHLQTRQ